MTVESMVHTVHVMWHPTGISFDADDFQFGMALKHGPKNERTHDVLAATNDRHKPIHLRSARWGTDDISFTRQNMEAKGHLQVNGRFEEGTVDRIVIIRDAGIA